MLHDLLTTLRERAGMKKAAVAAALDVERGTVYNWEDGSKRPTDENIARLADLYGATKEERTQLSLLAVFGPAASAPAAT
jgi:hypothetical protein